jgi:hypothetical protein
VLRTLRAVLLLCLVGGLVPSVASGANLSQGELQELKARFIAAQQARLNGELDHAIDEFRVILRRVPGDIEVRERLATALIENENYGQAQYHIEILETRATSAETRAAYRAALQQIRAVRPFGVAVVFGVTPSSNLNSGASNQSFASAAGQLSVAPDSLAQKGREYTYGLNGYYRRPLSTTDNLQFDWQLLQRSYDIDVLPTKTEAAASLTFQRQSHDYLWAASIGYIWEHSDLNIRHQPWLRFNGIARITPTTRVEAALRYGRNIHTQRKQASGADVLGHLRYRWFLQSQTNVWLGVQLEHVETRAAHQAYSGQIFQLGAGHSFRNGLVVDAVLSVGRRDFDGVFPLQSFARADTLTNISISAQTDRIRIGGLTPRITCHYGTNGSNIGLFETETRECGVILTRRF